MKLFLTLLLSAAALIGQSANPISGKEAADGWILLFDGQSLFGWTPEGGAKWKVVDGAIVPEEGGSGWLRSNTPFVDFILKLDFRTAADGNSGVFLRSADEGQPHQTGYELQIFDQHPKFPTGSLVNYIAAGNGRIKPNQWQTFEVHARGAHFTVKLDGKTVLDANDKSHAVGHIGLQYNQGKPIQFRNIKLKPVNLNPAFNGRDLTGWREVQPPKPAKEPAVWSVKGNAIHVEKGPGQLETEKTWDDFVLQLDIRTNTKDAKLHPNSGVFFRGTPETWWSGYESQIRNEHEEGDPAKPVDFGTGGIYRNQPARKIVAEDNEFFTKTLVAAGRHMAVWIDGYPVTSWEDTKPEGTNVRNKEAVLKPGVISLQAHDPTTNLDFKNIRIAPLPDRK